jgi:hypothetical protein
MKSSRLLASVVIAAAAVSTAWPAPADVFSIKAGAAYLLPVEASLKSIYGNGAGWSVEANLKIKAFLDLWAFGNYYDRKGSLPVTKEATEMRLIMFGGGLKFRLAAGPARFYFGAGPVACAFRENNALGLARGTKVGFVGQAGFYIPIVAGILLDFAADYSSVKAQPAAIKADLGGTRLYGRIGYVF